MISNVRVRLVEYCAGYVTDCWCDFREVLYVRKGELDTELRDGPIFKLRPVMSYHVSDHDIRCIAPRRKLVPTSSSLIRIAASRAPYLYRLQNNFRDDRDRRS